MQSVFPHENKQQGAKRGNSSADPEARLSTMVLHMSGQQKLLVFSRAPGYSQNEVRLRGIGASGRCCPCHTSLMEGLGAHAKRGKSLPVRLTPSQLETSA